MLAGSGFGARFVASFSRQGCGGLGGRKHGILENDWFFFGAWFGNGWIRARRVVTDPGVFEVLRAQRVIAWIDHFTVVCLAAWSLNESEAGVDLIWWKPPYSVYDHHLIVVFKFSFLENINFGLKQVGKSQIITKRMGQSSKCQLHNLFYGCNWTLTYSFDTKFLCIERFKVINMKRKESALSGPLIHLIPFFVFIFPTDLVAQSL